MAQVDTPKKLRDLYNLYVHDDELSIGLRDIGGENWQWDGPSNIKVRVLEIFYQFVECNSLFATIKLQVSASWLNSTIPYKPYLGTHWAYADCIIIRFNRQV